jgi:hypothetical protein
MDEVGDDGGMLCLIDILRESDGGGRGVDTVSKDV